MGVDLNGRVIAISGASSGIGEATAVACAARGMRVGLYARREVRLRRVAEKIASAGGEVAFEAGDVRDRDSVERFVTGVARRWGRLDAVVANAGFGVLARVADTPEAVAREIFDVNVLGTVWMVQAAWPIFEVQRGGHVVFVSSIVAKHGLPANGLYSATKAAQANLAEALEIEGRDLGVNVSVIYPVGTDTEFTSAMRDHTPGRIAGAVEPAGFHRQRAEEVAEAIVACLEKPRFEVYPYWKSRLLPWLEAASPTLAARVLRFPERYRRHLMPRAPQTSPGEVES